MMINNNFDILVVGGGNAAICAAITAAQAGKSVVLIESAPKNLRGGNSGHTRNFRVMHDKPLDVLTDAYHYDEYMEDLLKVTDGITNMTLAEKTIRESQESFHWMKQQKVFFQPSLTGTLSLSRTNAFFLGGGKALLNTYYRRAESLGVNIYYNSKVTDIAMERQRIASVTVQHEDGKQDLTPRAVIVAAGGYESNKDWLAEYWGEAAHNFVIRGTAYNQGVVLRKLMDQGLTTIGDGKQCHAVAVDGKAPQYDGGIATRLDCVPFSVVVNKHAQRFYDEGEDLWPKRYAIWGRLVAAQPDQIAYTIIDQKSVGKFMTPLFEPTKANSIRELGEKLNLPIDAFESEINRFNACCPDDDSGFMPMEHDGLATRNLKINKTNWARRIDTPPYYGFSLKTGITFTYLGLKVDENAQSMNEYGKIDNLWAAGEIMAGNVLGKGYLAGIGMTIGTVFGRTAGEKAAQYVQ